jgi:hypothetical protein
MKEILEETKVFNNCDEFNVYLSRNYNFVSEFTSIDGCEKIICKVIKPVNMHYNIPHIGVSILSFSKRIMNEVMCLAEDHGIELYYQDTDSMTVKHHDILNRRDDNGKDVSLSNLFFEKYNRKLIGKNLGQFNFDLKLSYIDEEGNEQSCSNVIATEAIFCGKKCYIDRLQGTKKVKLTDGSYKEDIHYGWYIRMKGVPKSTILYTCKKLGLDPFQLYERLFLGEEIEFDLTEGGEKCNFKFNKNYTIETIQSGLYSRRLSFK